MYAQSRNVAKLEKEKIKHANETKNLKTKVGFVSLPSYSVG